MSQDQWMFSISRMQASRRNNYRTIIKILSPFMTVEIAGSDLENPKKSKLSKEDLKG